MSKGRVLRGGVSCSDCGEVMKKGDLGINEHENMGEAVIKCNKCWGTMVDSLKERIYQLEDVGNTSTEDFKDCCECDELKGLVEKLRKGAQGEENKRLKEIVDMNQKTIRDNVTLIESLRGELVQQEKGEEVEKLREIIKSKEILLEQNDRVMNELNTQRNIEEEEAAV